MIRLAKNKLIFQYRQNRVGFEMAYFPRTLETSLQKASEKFGVVLVAGMRQSGKSTLLKESSEFRTVVTLEDFRAIEIAKTARNLFFEQYSPPILISEVQCAPQLILEIKALVDRKQKPGLVWLTCSQRFSLIERAGESLAGRAAWLELMPLSLYERQGMAFDQMPYLPKGDLWQRKLSLDCREFLWKMIWEGSFPELVDGEYDVRSDERHWFFNRFLRSYLENDVRESGSIAKLEGFRRFLVTLASHIGEELQIGRIAREAEIALQTAKVWLAIAQDSGIIWLLPAFWENVGKVLVKKPRLYFSDTGLATWLLGISSANSLEDTRLGEVFFKNFVLNELRKSWVHNGRDAKFYFYRDSAFQNIDLVIKSGGQYFPVMIKATRAPTESMVSSFDCLKGKKFSCGSGALICLIYGQYFLREDVIVHSVSYI